MLLMPLLLPLLLMLSLAASAAGQQQQQQQQHQQPLLPKSPVWRDEHLYHQLPFGYGLQQQQQHKQRQQQQQQQQRQDGLESHRRTRGQVPQYFVEPDLAGSESRRDM